MEEPKVISEQGVKRLNEAYGEGGWSLAKDRGGAWRVVRKSGNPAGQDETPAAPKSAEETATTEST